MLTELQIREYREKGWTVAPALVDQRKVSDLLSEMTYICAENTLETHDKTRMEMEPDQPPQGSAVRRLYEPCTHYTAFDAFSRSDRILDCVQSLIGPDILRHYSKINMKPARVGSVVEWHQDLTYYPLTNGDSLALLLYLDDANIENGCLKLIPGKHNQDLMDHTSEGFFQGRVTSPVDENAAEAIEGSAGTAIFMHAMTPHSSVPNKTNKPRRTLIISYRSADSYPIFTGPETADIESLVELVRGKRKLNARITFSSFPIPVHEKKAASLYELQEQSRAKKER